MMGMANMDFVIRECLAVVEGPLAMVRLGTCGAIQPPAHLGNFLVASQGSVCVRCSHTLEQSHLGTVTNWWWRVVSSPHAWCACSFLQQQQHTDRVVCILPGHNILPSPHSSSSPSHNLACLCVESARPICSMTCCFVACTLGASCVVPNLRSLYRSR